MRIESRRRLGALHVDVRGDGVAGLVDRDRARLLGHVLDADRRARLDRRHRVDDVAPSRTRARPSWCAIVSAIEQTCSIIAGE